MRCARCQREQFLTEFAAIFLATRLGQAGFSRQTVIEQYRVLPAFQFSVELIAHLVRPYVEFHQQHIDVCTTKLSQFFCREREIGDNADIESREQTGQVNPQ